MSGEPGLFASILPAGVAAADILDEGQPVTLCPQETDFVAGAGDKRRRDFALGRHCAHRALEGLGVTAAMLAVLPDGAPLWPEGVTGSITHTKGYAAAIAAPRTLFRGLGLDAERVGGVTEGLFARLFTPDEQEWLSRLETTARAEMATVMFSAKEAHYKAAAAMSPLRFREMRVTLDGVRISVQAEAARSTGRYVVTRGLVIVLLGFAA